MPIVARIGRISPRAEARDSLAAELSIAKYLASRNAPTIRPAIGADPGPHSDNGFAMTLWGFKAHKPVKTAADLQVAARALMQVHAALEPFEGDLPPFTSAIDACRAILADRTRTPELDLADRGFLTMLHDSLRVELTSYRYRCVPLHGDAHTGNVMLTDFGAIWGDLEATCRGPREWDIVALPQRAWTVFGRVDLALLCCLADLRRLCVAAWCWADQGRSMAIDDAARYHLAGLKARSGRRVASRLSGRF